jgi:hypothetical protein
MSAWIGKTAFLLGLAVFVAIRVPHDKRSKEIKIAESRKGALEATLLVLMGIGGFLGSFGIHHVPAFLLLRLSSSTSASLGRHRVSRFFVSGSRTPIWAQTGPTAWNFVKTIDS